MEVSFKFFKIFYCNLIGFKDYSDTKLLRILNSELADTLGNLLSRGCAKTLNPKQVFPKIHREHYEELIKIDVTKKLIDLVTELPGNLFLKKYFQTLFVILIFYLKKNVINTIRLTTFI